MSNSLVIGAWSLLKNTHINPQVALGPQLLDEPGDVARGLEVTFDLAAGTEAGLFVKEDVLHEDCVAIMTRFSRRIRQSRGVFAWIVVSEPS